MGQTSPTSMGIMNSSRHDQPIYNQNSIWNTPQKIQIRHQYYDAPQDYMKLKPPSITGYSTCYAHACAQGIISTQKRIIGRKQTPHYIIVNRIISKHGNRGANTFDVLTQQLINQKDCRGIGCKYINIDQALGAIKKQRVIIGSFGLSNDNWTKFSQFFQNNPNGILQKLPEGQQRHAIAIVGYQDGIDQKGNKTLKQYFKVKNSWGTNFAENGYFKVSIDFNFKFIDVFFRICDLPKQQILMDAFNDIDTESMFNNIYGCKHSLIDGINIDFMIAGKKVLIFGYRNVGRQCSQFMDAAGARVYVAEVDPQYALLASIGGYQVVRIEDVVDQIDIFITARGNSDIISHELKMKNNAIIMCIGHFDNEIKYKGLKTFPFGLQTKNQYKFQSKFLNEFSFKLRICILKKGNSLLFHLMFSLYDLLSDNASL